MSLLPSKDSHRSHPRPADVRKEGRSRRNEDDMEATMLEESRGKEETEKRSRPQWDRRIEFFLAVCGYAVGLGNILRFPWLLMNNGGGAFFIPYVMMLLIEGLPLLYLELILGQRFQLGAIPLWRKVSKYSSGLGVAQFFATRISDSAHLLLIACSGYYFAMSFKIHIPWSSCPKTMHANFSKEIDNPYCTVSSPAKYHWYNSTLQISPGIADSTGFKLNVTLTLCFFIALLLVSLPLIKGVKSLGKIVYCTVLFPLLGILVFLVLGFTLDGYDDGLKSLLSADFQRLLDPYVWFQAAFQVFHTLSLARGGMIAYSSYNTPQQDVLVAAVFVCIVNCFLSFFASLAVYALLGHRANFETGKCLKERSVMINHVQNVANRTLHSNYNLLSMDAGTQSTILKSLETNLSRQFNIPFCSVTEVLGKSPSGSELAFVSLAETLARLPRSSLFSVLFFLILITIALNTAFGGMQGAITSLRDFIYFKSCRLDIILVSLSLICFVLGFPFIIKSGEYFFQLINTFSVGIPYTFFAICEILATVYLYGINRLCKDVEQMTGRKLGWIWKILWCLLTPTILIAVLSANIYLFLTHDVIYHKWVAHKGVLINEKFPFWSQATGWMIISLCIVWIPIGLVFGCYEKWGMSESKKDDVVELKYQKVRQERT